MLIFDITTCFIFD